jgi:hypothetical protein
MRAAHNASTSGETRMITEDAEVSGERRWVDGRRAEAK